MERYQGALCANMEKKIEQQRVISRNCFATWGVEDRFEVQHHMDNHVVYLNDHHCSCGMFQMVGYPCCHALSCIALMREEINDYVDDCFKKDAYLKVYNHGINPVSGMLDYEDSGLGVVDPPHVRIMPGRPKKVRRRDANDIRGHTMVQKCPPLCSKDAKGTTTFIPTRTPMSVDDPPSAIERLKATLPPENSKLYQQLVLRTVITFW
ncbi:hypothetical protein BUALT_Bualt07G0023000 [Buddleja alternifolia]|uniref:SWIM-type domain-containing protein n=1 Tax=Buddleja alternifolia TaxID=168488 RepID=A0AAV6X8V0_9LAMI|nr:hypothetical protein BUALT_Bualt07G0023000 [Buddleja alternifolia]